jgi:hypothetical protein
MPFILDPGNAALETGKGLVDASVPEKGRKNCPGFPVSTGVELALHQCSTENALKKSLLPAAYFKIRNTRHWPRRAGFKCAKAHEAERRLTFFIDLSKIP